MRKNYLFTVFFCALATVCNAQLIDDDFESYNLGPLLPTAHWTNWSQNPAPSNNAENIIISSTYANSGTKSGYIGNNAIQDAVLLLGNLTSGLYTLEFNMYVPSGSEGYFNIQGTIPNGALTGVFNSGNIYFNKDLANPGVGIDEATAVPFNFPHDTWFPVKIDFDLDAVSHTYQMTINGVVANAVPTDFQADSTLGGIDFYSVSTGHNAYYDDIYFDVTSLSVDEFTKDDISYYPNPVSDYLNIESKKVINNVTVYNILGKVVLQSEPHSVSPKIDMSQLPTGPYVVRIKSEYGEKTVKIIK